MSWRCGAVRPRRSSTRSCKERKRSFERRIEAVSRIRQAASGQGSASPRSRPPRRILAELELRPSGAHGRARSSAGRRRTCPCHLETALPSPDARMTQPPVEIAAADRALAGRAWRNHLPWQNTRDAYRVWLSGDHAAADPGGHGVEYSRALPWGAAFPDVVHWPRRRRTRCWPRGAACYYSRAQPAPLRADRGAAAWRPVPAHSARAGRPAGHRPPTAGAIAAFCFGERAAILTPTYGACSRGCWVAIPPRRHRQQAARPPMALLPKGDLHAAMPRYNPGPDGPGAGICLPLQPELQYAVPAAEVQWRGATIRRTTRCARASSGAARRPGGCCCARTGGSPVAGAPPVRGHMGWAVLPAGLRQPRRAGRGPAPAMPRARLRTCRRSSMC